MDKQNASNKLTIMKLRTAGLEKEYNLIDAKFVAVNEENNQIELKMKKHSETILKVINFRNSFYELCKIRYNFI